MVNNGISGLQELIGQVQGLEIPEPVRAATLANVDKVRDANARWNLAAVEGASLVQEALKTSQAGFKALVEKVAANAAANVDTAFAVAGKLARSRSLIEVGQIQADYARGQWVEMQAQSKALIQLSERVATETLDKFSAITEKALANLKSAA